MVVAFARSLAASTPIHPGPAQGDVGAEQGRCVPWDLRKQASLKSGILTKLAGRSKAPTQELDVDK